MDAPPTDRRRQAIEASIPLALLIWRTVAYPASTLWRDVVVILALYWLFTTFAGRSRSWLPVTIADFASSSSRSSRPWPASFCPSSPIPGIRASSLLFRRCWRSRRRGCALFILGSPGWSAPACSLQFFGTMVPGDLPVGGLTTLVSQPWRSRTGVTLSGFPPLGESIAM